MIIGVNENYEWLGQFLLRLQDTALDDFAPDNAEPDPDSAKPTGVGRNVREMRPLLRGDPG